MSFLFIDFLTAPVWLHLVFALFMGACIGSFLNVAIYRIAIGPQMRLKGQRFNISYPPSHCPLCNHQLKWYENIPVVAWVLQQGKCRSCHASISYQYPLIEMVFAVSSVLAMWFTGPTLLWPVFLFTAMGILPVIWWVAHRKPWHLYMHGWYSMLFVLALICGGFHVAG